MKKEELGKQLYISSQTVIFITGASNNLSAGVVGERRRRQREDGLKCITQLQHMASFKRCRMGLEVCLQRIWSWERSAHPDLAKCGYTSVTHVFLE